MEDCSQVQYSNHSSAPTPATQPLNTTVFAVNPHLRIALSKLSEEARSSEAELDEAAAHEDEEAGAQDAPEPPK